MFLRKGIDFTFYSPSVSRVTKGDATKDFFFLTGAVVFGNKKSKPESKCSEAVAQQGH